MTLLETGSPLALRLNKLNEQEGLLLRDILAVIDHSRTRPACITCINFDEPQELCNLAGKRPPARIIATGCEAWCDDIPF